MPTATRPALSSVAPALAALLVAGCCAAPSVRPPSPAQSMETALELPMNCNGVATSPDGRVFVNFPHADGGVGVKVAEVRDGGRTITPYPNAQWNSYKPDAGDDAAAKFVGTNALRFGPDHKLWIVDTGVPSPGGRPLPGGAKLVVIDIADGTVARTIPLDGLIRPDSFIDDVRFNGPHAYLSDAGHPAILVLDLATGTGRRVLEDDPSTTAQRPMRAVGHVLIKFDGTEAKMNADQLEVSPDGRTFYFQPCPGPMVQIETRYLDDPTLPQAELARHVRPFCNTPTSGGTAIDGDGNIYLNDAEDSRLLKLTPDGKCSTLLRDHRLHWADAMWIGDNGDLWIPAAQMDRTATFNRGISAVDWPIHVYRMPLKLKPLRN